MNVEGAERRKRAARAAALKYAVTKKEATDRFIKDLKHAAEEKQQAEARSQAEVIKQAAIQKKAQEQLARDEARRADEKMKAEKEAEQKQIDEARQIDEEMRRRTEKQEKIAAERKDISRKLALKQKKDEEREAKRSGRPLLFGWRKYALLAILAVAGVSIAAIILNNASPSKPSENNSSIKVVDYEVDDAGHIKSEDYGGTVGGASLANNFKNDVEEKLENDLNYKYEDATRDFEETISSSAPKVKVYMSIAYADFIIEKTNDIDAAIEIMHRVEDESVDEDTKRSALFKLYRLYSEKGDGENAKRYEDAVAALEPKPDDSYQ